MIPRRVLLRGFLSYRDEAEIDFTGAELWILGGANGSGKSAVFDAVTYALFGKHRGGGSGADELLNKDSDAFAVEFEFGLESGVYRIRKTLKRTKTGTSATQQLATHGVGGWTAVPDTSRKTEFDRWIRDHIGLTYETFTSSVLLLQNKAERLIDASPKDRFAVLAGIVDLDRFVRLHQRADDERKRLKQLVDSLKGTRDTLAPVEPEELEALTKHIDDAEAAKNSQADEVARRQHLESKAKEWANLQQRVAAFRQKSEQNLALLKEAEGIERDLHRLVELRAVAPHVENAFKLRAGLENADRDLMKADEKVARAASDLAAMDARLEQAKGELVNLSAQRAALEQEWRQSQAGEKKSAEAVARLERCEEKRREWESVADQLKDLPPTLATDAERLKREVETLNEIAAVHPLLVRIADHRRQWRELHPRVQLGESEMQRIAEDGKKAAALAATLTARVSELREVKTAAERSVTHVQTLCTQAEQQVSAVDTLSGAAQCSLCGQPLTAEHLETERNRRSAERDAATARLSEAKASLVQAEQSLKQTERDKDDADAKVRKLRDAYSEKKVEVTQIQTQCDALANSLRSDRSALPPSYSARVAEDDTATTAYPTAADLQSLHTKLKERDRLAQELERTQSAVVRRDVLQKQHDGLTHQVNTLQEALGAAPEAIRQEHARLTAAAETRQQRLEAVKTQEADAQKAVEEITNNRLALYTAQTDARSEFARLTGNIDRDRQLLDAAYAALPESWRDRASRARLAEVNALKSERDQLVERRTEERAKDLTGARTSNESLRVQLESLQEEEDRVPTEARIHHSVAALNVAEAKKALAEREQVLADWRKQLALLEERRNRRAQVSLELAAAEKEHNEALLLAELLGRDRLQRHLVRQAERQIVGFANAVLDRLSEANLCLRLRGGDDDDEPEKALELEAFNRATGKEAIGIAFLSGSQKFRVAVSLALGIGQFASRRHRPIETVIIDEGFGCLDRVGRQTMIQELNNLRGHLKCILLVSHQEEFADAFPNGYRFELEEGTTRVTRVVR